MIHMQACIFHIDWRGKHARAITLIWFAYELCDNVIHMQNMCWYWPDNVLIIRPWLRQYNTNVSSTILTWLQTIYAIFIDGNTTFQ